MKYKILKGTALFDQLNELCLRIKEVEKKTKAIVAECGAKQWVGDRGTITGSINGFILDAKPEGWKKQGGVWNSYFPKAIPANKDLIERIYALEPVLGKEVNAIVGFKIQWVGVTRYNAPGVSWGSEVILVDVPECCEFTPPADMIEIVYSEYKLLKDQNQLADEKEPAE